MTRIVKAKWAEGEIKNVDFSGVEFYKCDLYFNSFIGCNFEGSVFHDCTLIGNNCINCNIDRIVYELTELHIDDNQH